MNTDLMFSKASDEWSTPHDFYDALDAEFHFTVDAAASLENRKCSVWYGGAIDALALKSWASVPCAVWLNPPYSRGAEFIAKAGREAENGCTVVCLLPARTDTRWFHEHAWDREKHQPRPGVEVRFVKGRLRFGGAEAGAPFPSVVIIFRPVNS